MSALTIRRRLNKAGLTSRFTAQKPFIDERNRIKRLAFAKKYVGKAKIFWIKKFFLQTNQNLQYVVIQEKESGVGKMSGIKLNVCLEHSKELIQKMSRFGDVFLRLELEIYTG